MERSENIAYEMFLEYIGNHEPSDDETARTMPYAFIAFVALSALRRLGMVSERTVSKHLWYDSKNAFHTYKRDGTSLNVRFEEGEPAEIYLVPPTRPILHGHISEDILVSKGTLLAITHKLRRTKSKGTEEDSGWSRENFWWFRELRQVYNEETREYETLVIKEVLKFAEEESPPCAERLKNSLSLEKLLEER